MRHRIAKLSPSAARLYIALLTMAPKDSWDDVVRVAGIFAYQTLITARQQLLDAELVYAGLDGQMHLSPFADRQSAHNPYASVIRGK